MLHELRYTCCKSCVSDVAAAPFSMLLFVRNTQFAVILLIILILVGSYSWNMYQQNQRIKIPIYKVVR